MLKKEIGLRIRNIRIDMNLSKQKLAKLLGISSQYLGMIERGNGSLSFEKLQILCNLTNLSADYILFGKDFNIPLQIKDSLSKYSDKQITHGLTVLKDFSSFLEQID